MTENDTPFRETKTQLIFKNVANLTLRGTTYDASHLDKFLGSDFGEKSTASFMHQRSTTTYKKDKSYNRSHLS